MQRLYIIKVNQVYKIRDKDINFNERNNLLDTLSETHFTFTTRSSDLIYIWKTMTKKKANFCYLDYIEDESHRNYWVCLEDQRQMELLKKRLMTVNITKIYEELASMSECPMSKDFNKRLINLRRTLIEALNLAIKQREALIYYFTL